MKQKSVGLLWGIVACISIGMLFGCKTTRYVPVESVRTEYKDRIVAVHDTVRDSVQTHNYTFQKDSMAMAMSGDTVKIEHWHRIVRETANAGVKERLRTVHDTVFVDKADTIASDAGRKAAAKVAAAGYKKDDGGGGAKTVVMLVVLLLATGTLIYKLRKP